jgi:RNA-directed DNA polymerase
MGKLKSQGKPFDISKWEVWEAFRQVKANQGAAGVDGQSIAGFEADLKNNLYKIWNRMSSGTYFPPAVRAVEIPKQHGGGVRMLGIPTVADRVAQTVVARHLGVAVEEVFHEDSYGYRPGRSALDAVERCRERCWRRDWVIDLDVQDFFGSVGWDLIVKAVAVHTDAPWVVLYVKRWLAAPLQLPDGTLVQRDRGTPQGGLCSAEHKPPYEQCWVMRSARRLTLVGRWRRPDAAHNPGGLEAGEPAEQFGVLVPFGQVGGDEVGVDGFEGLAFGLSGGARVDLGGG